MEVPSKIYKLEKFGRGYDKELILNYNKKTIGIRETNEKGYTTSFLQYYYILYSYNLCILFHLFL